MKILHLSKYYHPYRGGIEKVIKELSEASVKNGHEVTVICANESYKRQEEYINGVRVIRLPLAFTVFSQPITPAIFKELHVEIARTDVVHMHTPNPMYEFAVLQNDFDKPLVVTYHCEVYKARALNNLYQPVSNALLKRADKILVGTSFHIEHSRWLKEFAEKCEIIPFGIEPKYTNINEKISHYLQPIKMQYGSYFLFAGRMVPYKGVDVLLKAMLKVQDANLVLIGVGRMLDEWKALSKKLNLESRVHFVGKIESDDEFAAFVHGARALVLPSINEAEAFGLVLLEAMSCAKPVITTNLNSGVRFVNKANETGLMVPVMDVERLGEAMNRLLQDDVLYARLSKNAYEHFQNHFLISTCFARHEQIYQNLLQKLKRTA